MIHELKTWPDPFEAMCAGHKTHEIRKDDRHFGVGDTLHLLEWDPHTEQYSGRKLVMRVTYKSDPGSWGLPDDLCVLSLKFVDYEDVRP